MDADTHEAPVLPARSANLRSRFARGQSRPPTSVFIVGTLFSGSTLLGRDLTTRIRKAHYVGELNNFTQFPGLSHEGTGRTMCGPCSILGKTCRHFTGALRDRVGHDDILGMHEQFARSLGASAIIDGSKYVAWLRHALEQQLAGPADRPTPHVIVTVRNPIAFAISHRNRTGEALWQGAGIWRDTYVDALRTANTHGLPSLVMRYEDYMADPERSLRRLGAFLHLPLEDEPDNTALHDTGGNWSSFVPYVGREQVEKHIERLGEGPRERTRNFVKHAKEYWNDGKPKEDTRWHRSLDAGEANAVLSTPGLADVASLLGYNVAEVVHLAVRPGG
ncbi:sulfotransferase [Actinomadura sp. 7K534]|uniref:sulfotransferase n=1 Tax=Actinomadura sp. 7K534 TaxID=2530366 RepID=UPI00140516B9|nr:sulfotransferase [Actinomadura sp. 7K534]